MQFQIYSKDNCQYCTQAVALLTAKQLPFDELKLGTHFDRERLLQLFPSAKSFPQIELISDTGERLHYIGGFTELKAFLEY